jgi:hypothetical protein
MSLSFFTPYLEIQKYQKLEGKLELGDDKEVKERKYSVTIHLWPGRKNTVQMSARFPYPCVGSPSIPVLTNVVCKLMLASITDSTAKYWSKFKQEYVP